ncbi:MAG: aspartyl protease family protein [bacterium]
MPKQLTFDFQKEISDVLGEIRRPVAQIKIYSKRHKMKLIVTAIVDTGADYTIFPRFYAQKFGIDLSRAVKGQTKGVGGFKDVYLFKKFPLEIGFWKFEAPVAFLEDNAIPPLLGRKACLENFDLLFSGFKTSLSKWKKH